jgi:anthranilate phosphoribosyltransferase
MCNASQKERVASVLIVFLLALLLAAGGIHFLGHGNASVSESPSSSPPTCVAT